MSRLIPFILIMKKKCFILFFALMVATESLVDCKQSLSRYQKRMKRNEDIQNRKKAVNEKNALLKNRPERMSIDELRLARQYTLDADLYNNAEKILNRLILLSSDNEEQRQFRLELADVYFKNGNYAMASRQYDEYLTLYPGSDVRELDLVQYKKIFCKFQTCLSPACDQTNTRETLKMIHEYMADERYQSKYLVEIKKMESICQQSLFEHESEIIIFTTKRGGDCSKRLLDLKNDLADCILRFEEPLLRLEIAVAQLQGNNEVAIEKQKDLTQRFHLVDSPLFANLSRNNRSHADRF